MIANAECHHALCVQHAYVDSMYKYRRTVRLHRTTSRPHHIPSLRTALFYCNGYHVNSTAFARFSYWSKGGTTEHPIPALTENTTSGPTKMYGTMTIDASKIPSIIEPYGARPQERAPALCRRSRLSPIEPVLPKTFGAISTAILSMLCGCAVVRALHDSACGIIGDSVIVRFTRLPPSIMLTRFTRPPRTWGCVGQLVGIRMRLASGRQSHSTRATEGVLW